MGSAPPQSLARLKEYALCALALGAGPGQKWAILWQQTKNLRVRLKLAAYRPEHIVSFRTAYGWLYLRDNFGDITNLANLYYRRVYRPARLAQPGAILDAGANIGLAAALFAYHNPGRPIYCFEPLAANAALIRLNCPGAQVRQVALGARRGRVRLNVDPQQVMASRLPNPWPTEEVEFEVVSLDEAADADGLGEIALLKLDVEGMEIEILDGARESLKRCARVVAETHGRLRHEQLVDRLSAAGFRIDSDTFAGDRGLVFAARP